MLNIQSNFNRTTVSIFTFFNSIICKQWRERKKDIYVANINDKLNRFNDSTRIKIDTIEKTIT